MLRNDDDDDDDDGKGDCQPHDDSATQKQGTIRHPTGENLWDFDLLA
jgi:hypothetical protein